jgi:hypothetical protein
MAGRRYAEGTTVEVAKTKGEILSLLVSHGATHYGFATAPDGEIVVFKLYGRQYRFDVSQPTPEGMKADYLAGNDAWSAASSAARIDWKGRAAGEFRRRWRARLLWLKATLEFAEGDEAETARVLMPFLLLPGGATLAEIAEPQIQDAYATGRVGQLQLTGD